MLFFKSLNKQNAEQKGEISLVFFVPKYNKIRSSSSWTKEESRIDASSISFRVAAICIVNNLLTVNLGEKKNLLHNISLTKTETISGREGKFTTWNDKKDTNNRGKKNEASDFALSVIKLTDKKN